LVISLEEVIAPVLSIHKQHSDVLVYEDPILAPLLEAQRFNFEALKASS